jgi:tetratricopeptide (TPR) repeat protein
MNYSILLALFFIVGCASDKKSSMTSPDKVTNESFKKEKTLKTSEVQDFYEGNAKALSPALQNETIDRFNSDELTQFGESSDPLLQISILCKSGKYKDAFERAATAFNRYQKVALYWNIVGNCHLNQGSYRKALLFYNKALELKPNYVPALNNIGVMYTRQGIYQKAQVAFERAYNQSKFAKTPRYNLGKLYLSYGLADLALPIFHGLLSTSPNDVDLLNAMASCHFLRSDYKSALSFYEQIPNNLWKNPEYGLNIALTFKKANRPDDAKKTFLDLDSPSGNEMKRYYTSVGKMLGDI